MTYNQGYCYAYRRAWYHPAFKDLREASIWNYLYQNAAYEATEVNINGYTFQLKLGQIAISISYLSKGFCMSEKGVRVVIQKLEKLGMVGKQGTSRGTILTICNYEDYQRKEKAKGELKGNKGASKGRAKGDNINEDNEDNKYNEDNNIEDLPKWLSIDDWVAFKEMRQEIKKPMSQCAESRMIKKLDRLRNNGYDPSKLLDRSIINRWQDVFEDDSCKVKGEFSGMFG